MNLPSASSQQPGSPDPNFGNNGVATLEWILKQHPDFIVTHHFKGLTTTLDGKVLFSANLFNNGNYVFGLGRLNADGSLDDSWGKNGLVSGMFLPLTQAGGSRLVAQPDGKILMLGWTWHDPDTPWADLVIARFDSQGTLDPQFADAGVRVLLTHQSEGLTEDSATVYLQHDGSILVTANYAQRAAPTMTNGTVFRLQPNGQLDPSLNGNGRLDFKLPVANAATAVNACISQGNRHKIVIVGHARFAPATDTAFVARLNHNGTLDTTFGPPQTPGYHTVDIIDEHTTFNALVERADNSIVAAGQVGVIGAGITQGLLRAITPDGAPHLLFNNGQPLRSQFDNKRDNGWQCLMLTNAGNIVTASRGGWIYVARFKADGTLDLIFNRKGYTDMQSPVVTDPVLLTERGDQRIIVAANTLGITPEGVGVIRGFLG
ncbi:hypothetical protein RJC98_17860 [Pseudomonas allii]|uniref:Uncharacterized protein n=1 Tax=Pseudomonas allii TaxID=2740531 RepID=A0ACC6LFP6_9PSED|nr:hypothetical protein [Pseudomonas allii]MDR9877052.1 hypothetical protein [Pseudomonas allii]